MSQAAHNVLNSKNKPIHCKAYPLLRATHTRPHVGSRSRSVTGSLWWLSFRETLFAVLRFSLNCWNWKVSRDIILSLHTLPSLRLMFLAEKVQHRKKRKKMKKKNTALASLRGSPFLAPPVVADGILNLDWLLPLGDVWGVSSLR